MAEPKTTWNVRVIGWVFALGLLLAGVLVVTIGFGRPLLQVQAATGWELTRCHVVHAEVKTTYDSDDEPEHRLDLRYSFADGGQVYEGTRYSFFDGRYTGLKQIRGLIKRLRDRDSIWCYYDPHDPAQSVINPLWDSRSLFALMALGMIFFGAGLTMQLARREYGARNRRPAVEAWRKGQTRDGRIRLQPLGSRPWRVTLPVTLTSITVPLTLALWNAYPDWGEARFLVRLALGAVSLGATSWLVYVVLELVGPRFHISVAALEVRAGDEVSMEWAARSISPAIRTVRFTLHGRELADLGGSDGDFTKQHTFLTLPLQHVTGAGTPRKSTLRVAIPQDALPSFRSAHNKIYWVVRIEADVAFWPDVEEEFELVILPDGRST